MCNTSETPPPKIPAKYGEKIAAVKGKIDCLRTVRERPESKKPELTVIIHHLSRFLRGLLDLYGKGKPDNKEKYKKYKKRIKLCMKACNFLEDILIRVVLGGESLDKALKRAEPWSDPDFDYECTCNGVFNECSFVAAL